MRDDYYKEVAERQRKGEKITPETDEQLQLKSFNNARDELYALKSKKAKWKSIRRWAGTSILLSEIAILYGLQQGYFSKNSNESITNEAKSLETQRDEIINAFSGIIV